MTLQIIGLAAVSIGTGPWTAVSNASPSNKAYSCYWVTGRLSAANGNPTWRIWPKGTNRILGVTDLLGRETESPKLLPLKIRKLDPTVEHRIFGDFLVCPITKERKGWMRMVGIVDARRLTVIDYK